MLKNNMKYLGVGFFTLFTILFMLILMGAMLHIAFTYPILLFGGLIFLFLSWLLGYILEG